MKLSALKFALAVIAVTTPSTVYARGPAWGLREGGNKENMNFCPVDFGMPHLLPCWSPRYEGL